LSVAISQIVPNPDQPRRHFAPDALAALADSIRRHGILQPLLVRRSETGFELVAGERRLRAAQQAGLSQVPVVIRDAETHQRLELALIENIQRENLSALEEAEAYRLLIEQHGLTQEGLAERVGKSRSAVANALRLLTLPDPVKAQLAAGELSAGHARAVLTIGRPDEQVAFARDITDRRLPKAEAERLAAAQKRPPPAVTPELRALTDDLMRSLGTKVRITRSAKGGRIEIEFYSDAELTRLIDRLLTSHRVGASL
jgi:ParB family chromosome partitioning protein